ncbi:hypothetical protein ACLMJK_000955 [Lecanora helva]
MVRFFNPEGHNWGDRNLDGWSISQITFAVVYTIFFLSGCTFVWRYRDHPVIKMRNIGLALLSVLMLHVYMFAVLIVYTVNGAFACGTEFWIMSIYLPIGIGLFQAQNQQLLLVSTGQNRLLHSEEYKPLYHKGGSGIGGPRYWLWRLKIWWAGVSKQGKYEGYVLIGMVVQFWVSLAIFLVSRKFNSHGIVSHHTSPGLCRRGWEWAPSIVWQLLWNFCFGPYLLWKIRGIHDIYHWRLQTTIAIVAGLPGPPLWIIAVYTDQFASINRWWVPAMWLVPGLIAIELTTVVFPIFHIYRHKKAVIATKKALAAFDVKKLVSKPSASSSLASPSIDSRKGRMYSMESLDECLASTSNSDSLQFYATGIELNGENVIFLTKVLKFKQQWHDVLSSTTQITNATKNLFRVALGIYIQLVDANTAIYPINIESPIYAQLEKVFGTAASMIASQRRGSSSALSIASTVTPWETESPKVEYFSEEFPMKDRSPAPSRGKSDSSEHIVTVTQTPYEVDDAIADMLTPDEFDNNVFDAAFKSIRYMVWSETWQNYMRSRRSSSTATV